MWQAVQELLDKVTRLDYEPVSPRNLEGLIEPSYGRFHFNQQHEDLMRQKRASHIFYDFLDRGGEFESWVEYVVINLRTRHIIGAEDEAHALDIIHTRFTIEEQECACYGKLPTVDFEQTMDY